VLAVALDFERRADSRPLDPEIEVEMDFRHQPVGRAVILAADRDVGRGGRSFRRDGGVGGGGADIEHWADLSARGERNNPRSGASRHRVR